MHFPRSLGFIVLSFLFSLFYNNHKTNIKILLTAGVPLSQALPGFLITAPSVCVSAVLGALAVWIQNQKKKKSALQFRTPRGV